MIIVSYDISNTKLRTKFSKYLERYGFRLQCSVFQINNSPAFLRNMSLDMENKFGKCFQESDSVILFCLSETCKITKYGHSAHDDSECLFFT